MILPSLTSSLNRSSVMALSRAQEAAVGDSGQTRVHDELGHIVGALSHDEIGSLPYNSPQSIFPGASVLLSRVVIGCWFGMPPIRREV